MFFNPSWDNTGHGMLRAYNSPKIHVKMMRIYTSILAYRSREGEFPASLDALIQWPYSELKKEELVDPWGMPFGYEYSGDEYIIWSSGPDKKMGTADDIIQGSLPSYEASWKAKNMPPVDTQRTNAVREATPEPFPPSAVMPEAPQPAVVETKPPERAPLPSAQHEDEPAGTKSVPWKTPLLLGIIIIIGVVSAWLRFKKRK